MAGNRRWGFSGDAALETEAQLWGPEGVAVDAVGNLWASHRGQRRRDHRPAGKGLPPRGGKHSRPAARTEAGGGASRRTCRSSPGLTRISHQHLATQGIAVVSPAIGLSPSSPFCDLDFYRVTIQLEIEKVLE